MSPPAPRHWVLHWILGLVLSLLAAWAIGAVFLDTVQPVVLDPQVGRFVARPGTSYRSRSEGWSSSLAGEHGLRGLPGGQLPPGPKVVFWGDSFVEGLQVDDAERMAQVLSSLARQAGLPVTGVGVGTGGDSLIDSLFKLPDYAPALDPVALHVFFLGKLGDVLPDVPHDCRATFLSRPKLALAPAPDCPPSGLSLHLASAFRSLELGGAFQVYRRLGSLELRLGPGPAPRPVLSPVPGPAPVPATADVEPQVALERAWAFLLAELQLRAGPRVLLLYAPTLPYLDRGQVLLDDPEAATATGFAQACARAGVDFLDLGPAFAAHFRATGRLPRGFFNTPPGAGHLNQDGHRLVAQAVIHYLKERRNALLAP